MDITALTIWLPVIALATLIQAVVVVVGGLLLFQRLERAETRLDAMAAEVRPLIAQIRGVLDDVRDLSVRVRRADMRLTAAADSVARGVDHARTAVLMRAWPAVGVARAAAAAFRALRRRPPAPPDSRQDALALARFVNEGGQYG